MRSSASIAIFFGLLLVAFCAAMPVIVTWQAHNALAPFGALDKVDQVVLQALDAMRLERILGMINGTLLTLAGILIGYRRKTGYYLFVGLCGIAVVEATWSLVTADSTWGSTLFRLFLWGCMLRFVLRQNARHGTDWWRAKRDSPNNIADL